MGNFFDDDIDFYKHSLLNEDQQGVSKFFAEYIQRALGEDGIDFDTFFKEKFLDPSIGGFNARGGTRDQINANASNLSSSLSSRRLNAQADALGNVHRGAAQAYAGLLPAFMQREVGLANVAARFATSPTQQVTGITQPGLAEQISSGIELGGQIYGAVFGGGAFGAGGLAGGFGGP